MPKIGYCDTFWGSHGCDLAEGHEGDFHRCLGCSHMRKVDDSGAAEVKFFHVGGGEGEWLPGWKWFSNHGQVR